MSARLFHNIAVALATAVATAGLALAADTAPSADKGATKGAAEQAAKPDPRVGRARREVKLLDDIYKTAIVLITQHYVEDDSALAAGEAFKVLFNSMKEKGWHEVRLLDATGEPLNDANTPADDFERKAVEELKSGKPYYEEVVTRDGEGFLRAATPIPVVMEKCTLCHDNYKAQGKKIIGALGYTLPLDPRIKTRAPAKAKAPGKS